ncbi:hypothetical protein TL16_g06700 [Triparma laevis f. inornata]|uniref:Uncharacterized protein n=1 Tax=Triparma laevis f. inornata TaxID=1714386 RepID=A0A9W7EEN9_9STRA|nr:hypothetical protein TL16_g06700 [Triparma laevis f. inornata]
MYDSGYYPLTHPNTLKDAVTGDPVLTAIPQAEIDYFRSSFLIYEEPDFNKCVNTPYFCEDQDWEYQTWRRVCNDNDENPDYYDCNEVLFFDFWKNWADNKCCNDGSLPGLFCDKFNGNICTDDGYDRIRDPELAFASTFRAEFDYSPSINRRLGRLVMDKEVQESWNVGDVPADGFYKWSTHHWTTANGVDFESLFDTNTEASETYELLGQSDAYNNAQKYADEPFEQIRILVGNRPLIPTGTMRKWHTQDTPVDSLEDNQFWFSTPGCCQCQPEPMPSYFKNNIPVPGFPDNKHQQVQFTVHALKNLDVTPVVELVHGRYYPEFNDYFGNYDVGELHLHTPKRFEYTDTTHTNNMWLAVIEEDKFDGSDNPTSIELPFNLPIKDEDTPMENRVLISRPSNINTGDATTNGGLLGYRDRTETRMKQYTEINMKERWYAAGNTGNFSETVVVPVILIDPEGRTDEEDNQPKPVRDPVALVGKTSLWWNSGDQTPYEIGGTGPERFDFLTLPYLPFFSNCDGYDSYMSISRLIEEHPDCEYVHYDDTLYVSPYPWQQLLNPESDRCQVFISDSERFDVVTGEELTTRTERGVYIDCKFEESIDTAAGGLRWYEAEADTVMYRMTKEPLDLQRNFEAGMHEDGVTILERWGRRKELSDLRIGFKLVKVIVHSEATGMKNCIPRDVRMRIEYYQFAKGLKTVVSVDMIFSNLCTTVKSPEFGGNLAILQTMANYGYLPCPVDIKGNLKDYNYRLEFQFYALDWAELLNRFEFQEDVYLMFFSLVGLLSVMNAALIWAVNRLLTKLRHPPAFHAMTLVTIVADAPIFGVCLATVPYLITMQLTKQWFASYEDGGWWSAPNPEESVADFSDLAFEAIPGDWLDTLALTQDRIDTYRVGRTGTGLLAIGLYTTVLGVSLIVPDWMDEHVEDNQDQLEMGQGGFDDEDEEPVEPSPVWTPMLWKRSHLIWGSICLEGFLLVIWEFSYSALFEENVYVFIMVFKTIQMIMDVFMGDMLREHLMNAPLVVVIEVSEILVTMGASDFMDFTFSYFVELSVMIIERLYLDPALKTGWKLLPRWQMIFRRKFAKRKRLTRAQKQAEELEWRRINEEIELESEGIEPLLDSYAVYSVEITGGILSPFVNFFLIIYFNECQMPVNYGIRQNEMIFYTIFAVYMIPYSFLMDMFILNSQELIHGWKVYDYVSYQRYRFSTREQRWMLRSETLDESIAEGMQTLDLMCFSSQYYFLLALFSLGMLNCMFAMTIFLRTDYAVFGDPVMPMIFMLWFLFCELLKRALLRLSDVQIRYFGYRGLWKTKQIEGTVDDDVAAKLAIGEGRQADLEQERLELQALNSERFRHRFLDRNRPWILQHLVELLTPRSLEREGPDGRPVVEYIRDVYTELMAMGEGARKPGDRSDVSSDEEDELEDMRREWPRAPLQGPSLAIARLWLEKARKRRAFSKLVTGIIQSHKEASCNVCSRTEDNGALLSVGLATKGEFDQYAIDRLIGEFEGQYSVNEKDPNLWKAFFRSKAEYITRCNYCLDRLEQERLKWEAKLPGAGRPTRPDDISSDEEDEEVVFEQVFVTSASNEGKMMTKWLGAARKRIGGVFPRPDARKQMERHAERMRKRKLEGGKAKIAGMDDVDAGQEEMKKKWEVELNAASKALAIRWLRLGRDSVSKKFRSRGDELREGVINHVSRMPEEDDWFFGAALRIEGMNLQEDGSQLMLDRRSLEADEAVKIRKIQVDYSDFEKEKQKIIDSERNAFEQKMAEASDRVQIEVELRTRELNRLKEERKKENEIVEQTAREEEGAVSSEMMEAHRNSIIELEEAIANEQTRAEMAHSKVEQAERAVYDRKEQLAVQSITDRRIMAADNVQRIQRETMSKIKSEESSWQQRAARWLGVARRKVELKEIEDAEQQTQKRRRKRRG